MSKKITLILGAGASKPYGFPTGMELRNLLMKLDPQYLQKLHELNLSFLMTAPHPSRLPPEDELRKIKHDHETLERIGNRIGISRLGTSTNQNNVQSDFASVFKFSGTASIDTFLSHRSDYAAIGKKAIASAILDYESKSTLEEWDWYGLLWSKIRNFIEIQDGQVTLNPIPLDIITFNYDRSLEYFLWNALQSTYKCDKDQTFRLISGIKIIHFYGSLGPIYGENAITYGCANVDDAAKNIKVIPYERTGQLEQELNGDQIKAVELIHRSDNIIVYMGFGFDDQNCNLLKLDVLPKTSTIYGTTLGLTPFEKIQVGRKYFNIEGPGNIHNFSDENYGCIELIRNKPIFT